MSILENYAVLARAGQPFVSTTRASQMLELRLDAANKALARMEQAGLVKHIKTNLWMVGEQSPLALGDYVDAPYVAYVSLFTALHLYGFIEQIPSRTYMVSMGRPRIVKTAIGTISIHSMTPEMFGGFVRNPYPIATPSKSLVDFLYLGTTSNRQFSALPELTLPEDFDVTEAWAWVGQIPSRRIQSFVANRLSELIAA